MNEPNPDFQNCEERIGLITRTGIFVREGGKYFRVVSTPEGAVKGDEVPAEDVWKRPIPMVMPIIFKREST